MKKGLLAASSVLLLIGCAKRPAELQRAEKLDPECSGRGVAFSYPMASGSSILDRAVKVGCFAPIGAWTDENDPGKGGTRKLVHELRESGGQTMICCKP